MNIDEPLYSQTLTTILQLALVDLLLSIDIRPYTVIGHSSGEIAAAYTAGHLSRRSAIAVSYHRGNLASQLILASTEKHSMMAVGLSSNASRDLMAKMQHEGNFREFDADSNTVSCINSPSSVTVSGPDVQIQLLAVYLRTSGIFHRKLRVELGYHSLQMEMIAPEYCNRLGSLEKGEKHHSGTTMISSVSNKIVSDTETCEAQYWVQTMVSPVQFSNAVSAACMSLHTDNETTSLDLSHKSRLDTHGFLEIGPHAALRAPVEEIIGTVLSTREIVYSSTLIRNTSGTITFLQALGDLYCAGYRLDLRRVISLLTGDGRLASLLPSVPAYPFEHSIQHREDSRVNAELFSFAAVSLKEIKESSRSLTPALQQYALWL